MEALRAIPLPMIRMLADVARGGTTLAERVATAEAQIEAIHEAQADRDREIKALKQVNADINRKLDLLIEDKQRRDGVLGMGRWLITIGIPSLVGGAVLWVWHFLDTKIGGH